jgi:CubicO group peptidase (beta-lactamase class C family)
MTPDKSSKLEALCDETFRPEQPGGVLAVLCGRSAAFLRAGGMASLERSEPFRPDTVTGGASLGKQFTAAAVAMLILQGAVRREDDIHRFLPELPDYGAPLTIDHLVHHTGGLKDYSSLLEGAYPDMAFGNDEVIERLSQVSELDFRPGTKFQYCNSGYVILAEVVKRVSGVPFGDFVKSRIFEPLGMSRTSVGRRRSVKGFATGYMPRGDGGFEKAGSREKTAGPGSLCTTAGDMAAWAAFLQGSPEFPAGDAGAFRDLILTRGVLESGELLTYAFGLALWEFEGCSVISHEGGADGFRANMITFPDRGTTVLCLTNNDAIDPVEMTKRASKIMIF